jgi:hypothetical protein
MMVSRAEYQKEYNKRPYVMEKNRERDRRPARMHMMFSRHIKRKYGISFKQYTEMLINQVGCCKICDEPMIANREPHVDHCHKTGKVRSLLCFACNLMIANAKERVDRLERAIKYLSEIS